MRPATAPAPSSVALSVVVPVYTMPDDALDASLEELAVFRRARPGTELILVDDGSAAPTAERLARFAEREPGVVLLRNAANRGKGNSVARGLLAAQGGYRVFVDADLAYPADEIDGIVKTLSEGHDLAIACRVLPESRYLISPAFFHYLHSRHLMSRCSTGSCG